MVDTVAFLIPGDGSTTNFEFSHALLGGVDVVIQLYDPATGETVDTDTVRISPTKVKVGFAEAPAKGQDYRVVLVG